MTCNWTPPSVSLTNVHLGTEEGTKFMFSTLSCSSADWKQSSFVVEVSTATSSNRTCAKCTTGVVVFVRTNGVAVDSYLALPKM